MHAYRFGRHGELLGDLTVRQAADEEGQHLGLAGREARRRPRLFECPNPAMPGEGFDASSQGFGAESGRDGVGLDQEIPGERPVVVA